MGKVFAARIGKKIATREPTWKNPCKKYRHMTCEEINAYLEISKKYSCNLPFGYSGHHLDPFYNSTLPFCDQKTTKSAINATLMKHNDSCNTGPMCKSTKFSLSLQIWPHSKNITKVQVSFEDPEVEIHHSFANYKLENFLAETGGMLGLTLGASGLSIIQYCLNILKMLFKNW